MMQRLIFDGQPDWGQWDHTWYEDQIEKSCNGRPQDKYIPAKCGLRDVHPVHTFIGTAVVRVRRNEVVEVDLQDGSAKAAAMQSFMDRGFCRVITAPSGATGG